MEMDRRQFAVFILSVLYGPLLVSRMQESYKPENPTKPQPVGLQVSFSSGIPTLHADLKPSLTMQRLIDS